ncbi:hypothetical protein CASFOL_026002 [Castilleja foliolosa]|uniref:Uncharacterized protein n=1 Tax=Castilleja foliolosa TaxID=1961234 RepID=A0ABD3CTK7_9LAMI
MINKGKNVQAIISVTMLLLLLFAGQATAFDFCFANCAPKCLFDKNEFYCLLKCYTSCGSGKHYAAHQCARLITNDFRE